MHVGICIAIKNRSYLVVEQEDTERTYEHVKDQIQLTPSNHIEPPEVLEDGRVALMPLPNLLRSLTRIKKPEDTWTVVISDFGSTDVNVSQVCEQLLGDAIPYVVNTIEGSFNRGGGLDKAAETARDRGCDTLFFCDADMFFTHRYVFDEAQRELPKGRVYFPICFSYIVPSHEYGYWREAGYGMVFLRTADYFQSERWKQNRSWGWEDQLLHEHFKNKADILRMRAPGFYHQWHPNSMEFKTQEYEIKNYLGAMAVY